MTGHYCVFSNSLFAEGLTLVVTIWLLMLLSLRNFAAIFVPYAFPRLKAEEIKAAKCQPEKKRRNEAKKICSIGKSKTPPAKTAQSAALRATPTERQSPRATAHKLRAPKPKPSTSTPFKPLATTAKEAPQWSGAKVHVLFSIFTCVHPVVARLT